MILINGNELKVEKFPNGEVCIRNFNDYLRNMSEVSVTLKYEDDQDLINLQFVKKHIDNTYLGRKLVTILNIPYMPYSRMDRTEDINVFTLKYVAEIINSLNFNQVRIYEPHSDVTPALIDRCVVIDNSKIMAKNRIKSLIDYNYEKAEDIYLVFPDASAEKRYNKGVWNNTLTCIKRRDFETGKILSLEVLGVKPNKPFKAVIVDDLCSRGGTFMLTAQKLKEMGARSVELIVTHCEDSIHEGDILKTDLIDKVYTTDSILKNTNHEKLEVLKCL